MPNSLLPTYTTIDGFPHTATSGSEVIDIAILWNTFDGCGTTATVGANFAPLETIEVRFCPIGESRLNC